MAEPDTGPPPVLAVADPAATQIATRLCAGLPGAVQEGISAEIASDGAGDWLAVVLSALEARRPCVCVGPIEPLLLAIAPAITGQDPHRWAPLVAVTPDGGAALPLLGGARGGEALAEVVARALGLPPRTAATAAGAGDPLAAPSAPDPAQDRAQERTAPRSGRLAVVGLGPGASGWMAPSARGELDSAEDIIGYTTYVQMAGPFRPEQRILDSDNRREMDRARLAFSLAAQGRRVALVSSGDPGIFAMAAAVLETLEQAEHPAWQDVDLVVLPGISAAQAAAARAGAPLGHDFCVLSLSDNLKPWSQIERRLEHAAAADLVVALYNPSSLARPWQLESALALLRRHRAPRTPVVLGRDVGRPGERVLTTTLGEVIPGEVDMRTVVIVGSSQTRMFPRQGGGFWVYTPRWYPDAMPGA